MGANCKPARYRNIYHLMYTIQHDKFIHIDVRDMVVASLRAWYETDPKGANRKWEALGKDGQRRPITGLVDALAKPLGKGFWNMIAKYGY